MSDSLEGLRRKLDGARQLGSVVRAMKAISGSSIIQYEKAVEALSDYQHAVELGLSLCLGVLVPVAHGECPCDGEAQLLHNSQFSRQQNSSPVQESLDGIPSR